MNYTIVSVLTAVALCQGCVIRTSTSSSSSRSPESSSDDSATKSDGKRAKARTTSSTRGYKHKNKTKRLTAKKPPRDESQEEPQDTTPENGPNGLIGNVYRIGGPVEEIPAFDSLGDPVAQVRVDNLNVAVTNSSDGFPGVEPVMNEWFGVHFMGSLNITEAGEYEFCINSSDGAILFLDGVSVVDNDGLHAEGQETCELIYAEPGEYEVQMLYFQGEASSPITLQWTWAKDGGIKEPVPKQALFVGA